MMVSREGRHLFQIDRPHHKLEMSAVKSLLEPLGVKLDHSYGPILINPRIGRYVVRGSAAPDALERVRALEGVTVFSDSPVGAT